MANISNPVPEFNPPRGFAKLRVGSKTLEDAILNIGSLKKTNSQMVDKANVIRALANNDANQLRDISSFFYRSSGIYNRLCRYLAYLYKYDWVITPYINNNKLQKEKIIEQFNKVLIFCDSLEIKRLSGEMALKTCVNGQYYGYIIDNGDKVAIQELPIKYCRSRFACNNIPVVEFNVKFFDDQFRDAVIRTNIIKSFPKEIQQAYLKYKSDKLPVEQGDTKGWVMLSPELAFKLNINNTETPILAHVIPSIIDLDEAQELDKKKMQQELLKIIIQKLPLDKNNELIFDITEAQDLHNNVVQMLSKAIGVDILTTFADIEVANLADKNSNTTSKDDLQKVERAIYNEAGVSQMLFATNGNLALEKSIANDEASMYDFVLQIQEVFNRIIKLKTGKSAKKVEFKLSFLMSTIYNYKDLSKLYKEQATLGYSKMLPQVALGQSQREIIAMAKFENEILDLNSLMTPLQSSNTMSSSDSSSTGGRPEKNEGEKSDKTMQNKEAMN